jgi:hypothetical protein
MGNFLRINGKDMSGIKKLLRNGDEGMDASSFGDEELRQLKTKKLVRVCPKTGKIKLQGGRSSNEKLVQTYNPAAAKELSQKEDLSTRLDLVLENLDTLEEGRQNRMAIGNAIFPSMNKYIDKHFGRLLKKADHYAHKMFRRNVQSWVDNIAEEVGEAERRGDGDVSSLDHHDRARAVANDLFKIGAKGSERSIYNDLKDLENKLVDKAFTAATR